MFESLLVANRGEIARRVIRSARALGIRTVAVHASVDAELPFVAEADEAVELTGPPAQAYRDVAQLLDAARKTSAVAVHPGYGFLSEDPEFARAVSDAGLVWVGPDAAAISAMGDKVLARQRVAAAGVPVAAGSADAVVTEDAAVAEAARVGFPVMLKAAAGGGGMGMAVAADAAALRTECGRLSAFAGRLFGDPRLFVERYFPRVRHVEVQVLGLADGRVVALGERDCSVQRRHQKLVEESPSPGVSPELRSRMEGAAVLAASAVDYRNAGTVEFLLDQESGEFFFLEMNTRLQVEHPVTELRFGVDLVAAQLLIAAGAAPGFDVDAAVPVGHAIELRVNAEDPKRFLPGPGPVTEWVEPAGNGVRVDAGYAAGTTVTPFFDSLLAKLIVHGRDRAQALARARAAVAEFRVAGPKCNLPFHAELLQHSEFVSGCYDTGLVARMRRRP
ncbi:MAG TPA: biotin carboxylase N-terminal domain-containing protein [Pseudonocardiaceae bacterium]|nr:biotin carboxylase N-terminal domain-containing protein [Pseudonocardiaceae bacterium]